VLEKMDIR